MRQRRDATVKILLALLLSSPVGCSGARRGNYQSGTTDPESTNTPDTPWEPSPVGLASRTVGVAPLYVFFDVTQDESVTWPPEVDGHREFADVQYDWAFGDGEAGNWGTSGMSKNRSRGYVAAHVYEVPGSYEATLRVRNHAGDTEEHTVNILVEDPDEVYVGQSTICVTTGGTFDGCPAGARQVVSSNLAEAVGFLGTKRRVLLRRGDQWSQSAGLMIEGAGPMTLGAFGECISPTRLGVCANAPLVEVTGAEWGLGLQSTEDLRIMDLAFEPADEAARSAVGWNKEVHRVLLLRLRSRGFNTPLGISHWETRDPESNALVECDVADTRDMTVYIGGVRLGILGNDLRDSRETHVLRVWQAHRAVIQHNEISGTSLETETGRHALKLHGPRESLIASTEGTHLDFRTRYVIVSHNVFGASGPWPVTIEPQDSLSDERIEDILFEGNRVLPGFGRQSVRSVSVGLNVWARHVTLRNNVITSAGADPNGFTALALDRYADTSLPVPEDVRVFQNTIVFSEQQKGTNVVVFGTAVGTHVANNLIVTSGEDPFRANVGERTIVGLNLVTPDARFGDISGEDPLAWDFSLEPDSPAIDGAGALSVYDDFAGDPRPIGAGYDFGAFERQ